MSPSSSRVPRTRSIWWMWPRPLVQHETMTESGMSCSTEDTGTQYCSRDAAEELTMPEYDFSVHYPVSLREEDCDWGEKREFYFQYFPEDPWDLQRNLISH